MEEISLPQPTDVSPSSTQQDMEPRRLPMQFTGTASEYFRIWIVNIALSIVTLGIYSAWAKVRTKNYFYKHTVLDGSCFEYHAVPRQILKGRIIVAACLAAVFIAKIYSLQLYAAGLVVLFAISPAIMVMALAFNARNSSYRNVRFAFDGTVKSAYKAYLIGLAVYIFTIGLGFPYFHWRLLKYGISHHRYGNQRFHFHATAKPFFSLYGRALGILIVSSVTMLVPMFVLKIVGAEGPLVLVVLTYAIMFLLAGYLKARQANLIFGSISISEEATASMQDTATETPRNEHFLVADQKVGQVIWLLVGNLAGIVATLGLLIPWAKIRTARYRAEHLHVLAHGDLVATHSGAPSRSGLVADAATDLGDIGFDFGI